MENVNEVKLAKFKLMLNDVSKWLYSGPEYYNDYAKMPWCLPVMDEKKVDKYFENQYLAKIHSVCYYSDDDRTGPSAGSLVHNVGLLRGGGEVWCHTNHINKYKQDCFPTSKIRGGMIFLALLAAAIDDDFYDNEINMISDLACMLDFTEDMMSDWIDAVKYLLDGNMFSEDMELEFKTEEADKFFKHIE